MHNDTCCGHGHGQSYEQRHAEHDDHGHSHSSGNLKRSLPSLLTGLLLAILLILYMVTFQVRFTEVAVVKTFGSVKETGIKTEPGLYWKWPWPIQRVETFDHRLQVTTAAGREFPTRDGKNIIVTTTVNWKIDHPLRFLQNCKSEDGAEDQLKSLMANKTKNSIGSHAFSQLISERKEDLKYDDIAKEIETSLKKDALDRGIDVVSVKLETLAFPTRISENVFDAMKKERQAKAAMYTSEGESIATQIKNTAEGIAGTINSFAELKAEEIVAEGYRRAADYNKTFAEDPELASFLLITKYLPEILKDRTTLILNAEAAGFTPLFSNKPIPAAAGAPTSPLQAATDATHATDTNGDPLPEIIKTR